jgi:hypothetical protein
MLNDTFPEMGSPPIADGNWPLRLNLHVANHVEDLAIEEMQQRAAAAFGGGKA